MYRAGHQTRSKTIESIITATEHDFVPGIVVRQHADDELAIEQIADVGRRPETERLKFANLIRTPDIRDHPSSGSREVRGHCRSHVPQADKADFTYERRPTDRFRAAPALERWALGQTSEGERRTGFVLGHGGSWPTASAPAGARFATDTSRYLVMSGFCACPSLPRS